MTLLNNFNILNLPIKKKFFYLILSKEKKNEYREYKDFYISRFENKKIDALRLHFYKENYIIIKVKKILVEKNNLKSEHVKTSRLYNIYLGDIIDFR